MHKRVSDVVNVANDVNPVMRGGRGVLSCRTGVIGDAPDRGQGEEADRWFSGWGVRLREEVRKEYGQTRLFDE